MKALANKYQSLIIGTALLSVFVVLQMRVQSILPAIMQDEYVYSMQARKLELSEIRFANYLYSWIYSGTNMCGINFYSCAKNLNLLFFAGFVGLIFWLATRFVNRWWAGAVALAVALSPLSTYTSVFMPESMYMFFALLSVIALWQASKQQIWWHFALAGVALGLTSLVKPHALFLAAGAVLYLAVLFWGNYRQMATAVGAYLGGTLITKLGLGFLLAGPNGLTLFGPSYSGALSGFVNTILGRGSSSGSTEPAGPGVEAAANEPSGLVQLATYAITQLGWQSVVIGLLAAGLIAAASGGFKLISKTDSDPELLRLTQLLLISLATMLFVIAAFSAQVTYSGDDHTSRLLLRYFEFLIAPIAVVAVAAIAREQTSNLKARPLLVVTALAAIAAVGYYTVLGGQQMFADSTFLYALTASDFARIFGLFFVLASLLAILFAWQLRLVGFVTVLLIGFGGLGTLGMQRLYNSASVIGPMDSAGIFARDYLALVPSDQIFFLGTNKQLTEASIFWLDKPNVQKELFVRGSLVDESLIPEGVRWIVVLNGIAYQGERLYEVVGGDFSVARVGPIDEHRFDLKMLNSPLQSFTGLSEPTALGTWNTSDFVTLELNEPLPANARFTITVSIAPSLIGQPIKLKLGDSELEVTLEEAGVPIDLNLEFNNDAPAQALEIQTTGVATMLISRLKLQ